MADQIKVVEGGVKNRLRSFEVRGESGALLGQVLLFPAADAQIRWSIWVGGQDAIGSSPASEVAGPQEFARRKWAEFSAWLGARRR
jgi:hypothetical protein